MNSTMSGKEKPDIFGESSIEYIQYALGGKHRNRFNYVWKGKTWHPLYSRDIHFDLCIH